MSLYSSASLISSSSFSHLTQHTRDCACVNAYVYVLYDWMKHSTMFNLRRAWQHNNYVCVLLYETHTALCLVEVTMLTYVCMTRLESLEHVLGFKMPAPPPDMCSTDAHTLCDCQFYKCFNQPKLLCVWWWRAVQCPDTNNTHRTTSENRASGEEKRVGEHTHTT